MVPVSRQRLTYLWDYDLSESHFAAILQGKAQVGCLDQDWAACHLLEFASYEDVIRLLGFSLLLKNWARWRPSIHSLSRKRGFDFLVAWLPKKHPELYGDSK